jgi:hypothetical protein
MPDRPYLTWPVFRRSVVAAFGRSVTLQVFAVMLVGGVALSTHLGKAGTRVLATSSGTSLLGLNVGLSLVEDLVSLILAPLAVAHPFAALFVACGILGSFVALLPTGWRFFRSRLQAVNCGLQHVLLDPHRRRIERWKLPERVIRAMREAHLAADVLVLPATVTGLRGIPRFATVFVAIEDGGVRVLQHRPRKAQRTQFEWPETNAFLTRTWSGWRLSARVDGRTVRIRFFPMTRIMASDLKLKVPDAVPLPQVPPAGQEWRTN